MDHPPTPTRATDLFLFVARQPTPGIAKTRLGQAIGMERAAALYEAFLVDLSARFGPWFEATSAYDFGWAHSPPEVDFAAVLAGHGEGRSVRDDHRFLLEQGQTATLNHPFASKDGKPTLVNAIIDPAAGTESGRIGNLNPQSAVKKKK